jgi:hypothetical protein
MSFFVSDEAAFITRQRLFVDGGRTHPRHWRTEAIVKVVGWVQCFGYGPGAAVGDGDVLVYRC